MVRIKELAVQNVLEREYRKKGWGVKREVSTVVGYIDLLVWKPRKDGSIEKVLIEVKERGGLKGAIGQVEMYSKYEICDRKVVIYFSYDSRDRGIADSYYLLAGIEVESINRMIDINEVIAEQYRLDNKQVKEVIEDYTEEDICQEIFTSKIVLKKRDSVEVWTSSLKKEETLMLREEDIREVQLAKEGSEEVGLKELTGIQSENIMW
jgi:hypothetical protein